ncbi:hypothetical protein [Natronoglycomyces albus]|uniref:Uncharacterized protein n=1 Tax=Natronoglycomyces albus TaxID=2811108 RepID=A0A895XRP9_9ACTN|nr:hypothetical protein [Natronoglycomyces albus]QSB06019.1 hypothetical protein JQS30_03595 [Natronoglycomyces albus]
MRTTTTGDTVPKADPAPVAARIRKGSQEATQGHSPRRLGAVVTLKRDARPPDVPSQATTHRVVRKQVVPNEGAHKQVTPDSIHKSAARANIRR